WHNFRTKLATKKTVPPKKAAPAKATAKKTPAKKSPAKKGVAKGSKYTCKAYGLVIVVDQVCGCSDVCDLVCCEQVMVPAK
ncbi:MAG: hypothetical protein WCN99_05430, partial [bacterium]